MLGVSPDTVRALVRQRRLVAVDLGVARTLIAIASVRALAGAA